MNRSGLILLNKRQGITSFEALKEIKRSLGTGKVGHTGTLDKFASGLLIVLTGNALKLTQWFTHLDKQYVGKIRFGEETDTLDPEGEIIARSPLPLRQQVESVLPKFTGEILQAPPAYSAIHINGERASALARAGKPPEMKKRPVTIYTLELKNWKPPFAQIYVRCSSGTYIRSLARDIALAVESRGHLVELIRTHIAGFTLGETCAGTRDWGLGTGEAGNGKREAGSGELSSQSALETTRSDIKQLPPVPSPQSLVPINKSIITKLDLPILDVTPQDAQKIRHGKPLEQILNHNPLAYPDKNFMAIFSNEELIAVVENEKNNWKYSCVMCNINDKERPL